MKRQIETIDIVLFGLLFVVSTSILGLVEERVRLLQTIETLRYSNAVLEEENRALRAQCATCKDGVEIIYRLDDTGETKALVQGVDGSEEIKPGDRVRIMKMGGQVRAVKL